MESNVVVLAVRKGEGPADWASLTGSSIYMQVLNEPEGKLVGSKYMEQLLVMVWKSEADLQAGRQPILLFCTSVQRHRRCQLKRCWQQPSSRPDSRLRSSHLR